MENISYVGLSQQIALKRMMDVVANNVANMSTPGYKSQQPLFSEYINTAPERNDRISQVQDIGTYKDMTVGAFSVTSNPLDVALDGEGFFAVQGPGGVRYTRDGGFSLNDKKEIVTKAGFQVLGDNGQPLTIQPNATQITITSEGAVSTEQGPVGKLKITEFNNPQNLIPLGNNLYEGNPLLEKPAEKTKVSQGMLEGSNVQPVLEINQMIEVLRSYQAVQRMLSNDHDRIRNTIQRLTRTQ